MDDELAAVLKEQVARIRDLAALIDHKPTAKVLRNIADKLELVVMVENAGMIEAGDA